MSTESLNARDRLLEVIRILQEHTDETAKLTIHEIHGFFPEHTKVGIRAIRDDVQSLENSIIFPVIATQEKNGMTKQYHYDGRLFEVHELRLLMDAISAAKFIPKRDTDSLLMKIRNLTSRNLAKQLKNELQVAEEIHSSNHEIISTVQLLHEAIHDHRVVTFQYGRYGTDLSFTLSKGGYDYCVKPLGLVWNHDRYYLTAHYAEADEIRQYRVDRMRNVLVQEEQFIPDPYFNLHAYTSKMFHMFGGDTISLEAQFEMKLLNVVIDRFGLHANITDQQVGTFLLKEQVTMSEGLLRWLFRWGGEVNVFHPEILVTRMREEIEKMHINYH